VFYEYVQDTACMAREKGLSNILVTAGYINEGPLRELAQFIDAANIDLKSMSEEFYNEICGATLEPVQRCISVLHEMGVWIEVTNLIIPTLNDSEEQTERLYNWVLDTVGPDVPLHFSRFFPMYRMVDLPPTPAGTLASARSRALESGLNHVYVGNVACADGADTFCSSCGRRLIERQGYSITANSVMDGVCTWCSSPVPGIWNRGGASNGGE
jgi:pyruvate formate lyase activating enzyme